MSTSRSNDDLDGLAARLRGLPEPPVPPGLEARLLAAIPDAAAAPRRPRRWALLGLGALAAAVALLAGLLGHFFGTTGGPPDGPHPPPTPGAVAERPPTFGNYRPAEYDSSGLAKAGAVPLPASFEWPVRLAAPAAGRPLPEGLTD